MPEMKKYNFAIFCMCLALFGLFYLLKDSVSPQNQDFLKGVLSASIGGLIGAIGNFIVTLLNNDKAEQRQRVDFELQMKKLRYEERKKLCADFLSLVSPYIFPDSNFDILKIINHHIFISLDCPDEYAQCARQLYEILIYDKNLSSIFKEREHRTLREHENISNNIKKYTQFYTMFIKITQKMLTEEELISPGKWDLNDFEGSVPLDYKKLLP